MISVTAPANAVIGSPWRSGPPNGWSSIRNLSRITTEKSVCAKFLRVRHAGGIRLVWSPKPGRLTTWQVLQSSLSCDTALAVTLHLLRATC